MTVAWWHTHCCVSPLKSSTAEDQRPRWEMRCKVIVLSRSVPPSSSHSLSGGISVQRCRFRLREWRWVVQKRSSGKFMEDFLVNFMRGICVCSAAALLTAPEAGRCEPHLADGLQDTSVLRESDHWKHVLCREPWLEHGCLQGETKTQSVVCFIMWIAQLHWAIGSIFFTVFVATQPGIKPKIFAQPRISGWTLYSLGHWAGKSNIAKTCPDLQEEHALGKEHV